MDPRFVEAYRFFRKHAGYIVGHRAECAFALATAEQRARAIGLTVVWDLDPEPYQSGGDHDPRPPIVACAHIPDVEPQRYAALAALGGIGLTSWQDNYVRVAEAELAAEALDVLDRVREREATEEAEELASRATYAGMAVQP